MQKRSYTAGIRSTDKYFFFFGNNVIPSNFYISPFRMVINNQQLTFNCSEKAFMYSKAVFFGDQKVARDILLLTTNRPAEYKRLGRLVKNYDDKRWNAVRFEKMYEAVKAKFSGNPYLLKYLLSTGDKVLVEASPFDTIWGVGLDLLSDDVSDESKWRGQNLLGKVLMKVREELR